MRRTLTALFLGLAVALPQAHAGMIPTEGSERERVLTLVEKPEVAAELQKMGIPADEAKARVAAMTDAEVASLAGRLDTAIAGGAISNTDLLLILILILLVAIVI
jgi:hypothetical protein